MKGGLVYGDGANMNAVLGIMDVGCTGLDVLHLNLTKPFPLLTEEAARSRSCVRQKAPGAFLPVPR